MQIPIPGDLIMLGAAARAAAGQFDLVAMILTFLVAMMLGGTVQYLLARGPGRGLIYRFGRYIGLTGPRLDRAGARCNAGSGRPERGPDTPGVRAARWRRRDCRLPFAEFPARPVHRQCGLFPAAYRHRLRGGPGAGEPVPRDEPARGADDCRPG